jgi:tripartite-type tricarboxylate transporter receptor subunit TctC
MMAGVNILHVSYRGQGPALTDLLTEVFAFLRLNGTPFKHEHVFDASAASRGQLP